MQERRSKSVRGKATPPLSQVIHPFEIALLSKIVTLAPMLYAHSKQDSPPKEWHSLETHLRETANKAQAFAASWGTGEWAWNAAWLHDIGKADSSFQGYLLRCNELDDAGYDSGKVNHSSAGAACAEDQVKPFGRILSYLVAGHHAGLPDWDGGDTGAATLKFRIHNEGRENLKRIASFADEVLVNLQPAARPSFVKAENFHFWVRMLFSCLVDADFLDTEQFMDGGKTQERGQYPNLRELAPRLFQALDKVEREAAKTTVNAIRAEIRRACEQKTATTSS